MLNSFYDKFIFTNGLKYTHNNFYLINLPFVILPVEALIGIANHTNADSKREIYYAIKNAVKDSLKKEFQVDFGVQGDKGLEFMETYFTASGWGKLEKADLKFEEARAIINVTNSPVAINCKNSDVAVDTFLRGFLAGIFSIYFKKDVDCVEVRCTALNDNNCEFVVKPLKDFNFDNKMTREQLNHE